MKMIRKANTSTEDCDVPFSWETYECGFDPTHRHFGKSFLFNPSEMEIYPTPGQCESLMFLVSREWVIQGGAFKNSQKFSIWGESNSHGRTVKFLVAQENSSER